MFRDVETMSSMRNVTMYGASGISQTHLEDVFTSEQCLACREEVRRIGRRPLTLGEDLECGEDFYGVWRKLGVGKHQTASWIVGRKCDMKMRDISKQQMKEGL
jgi:hypothetical protein